MSLFLEEENNGSSFVLTSSLDVSVKDCSTAHASSDNSLILCECKSHELSLSFGLLFAGDRCGVASGILVFFVVESSDFFFFAS